jgi:uncharacterized protein YbjQ (UPF0145 family)
MAKCKSCGKDVWRLDLVFGVCDECRQKAEDQDIKPKCRQCGAELRLRHNPGGLCEDCVKAFALESQPEIDPEMAAQVAAQALAEASAKIILTTESAHDLPIDRRLDIVTAEVVIGLHVFKDIAADFRDIFGGRSKVMQNGLRDARKTALDELRREAAALGADAVVAIDLDYSELSGPGKMLFLVASGTAVTLKV